MKGILGKARERAAAFDAEFPNEEPTPEWIEGAFEQDGIYANWPSNAIYMYEEELLEELRRRRGGTIPTSPGSAEPANDEPVRPSETSDRGDEDGKDVGRTEH